MKLTLLCDNHTYIDRYYLGEPAFSCLIEDGDTVVLFDTGYSDVFLENARRMGIDLGRVTHVVLSHGHNDHTGGLAAYFRAFPHPVTLVAHPELFSKREHFGVPVGIPEACRNIPDTVSLRLSREPLWLNGNVCYLGEIPRRYAFEDRAVGERILADGSRELDFVPDDSSLAIRTKDGLFLVSGCAHAGIANTLTYAKETLREERVAGVLGGMHLFETDDAFNETAETLRVLGANELWPCHCTSLEVKAALMARFRVKEAAVGLTLER